MKYLLLVLLLFGQGASALENPLVEGLSKGSATAEGLLSVVLVPAKPLSKTLPKGVRLAPELMMRDGTYPAAMFIGRHENLSTEMGGRSIVLEQQYNEATLTLTVVGPSDPNQRYSYTSRIVVDSIPAMLMGWALGYPKRMAKIVVTDRTFHADFGRNFPVLDVRFKEPERFDPEAFQKNMKFLLDNMHPTIGRTAAGWICYDFVWDFAHASVAPVNARIQFFPNFAGKDLSGTYISPQLDKSPFGTLKMRTPWEMAGFRDCK